VGGAGVKTNMTTSSLFLSVFKCALSTAESI
jgi:hypothetical protein